PPLGVAASGFRPLRKIPHCCLPQESGPCLSPSVAGRPLRPATRNRLGRPLPHQQADRPRANPLPHKAFHPPPCDGRSYPLFDSATTAYSVVRVRFLTYYSRLRLSYTPEGCLPLVLHMLSTPPSFLLSQNQTIHTVPTTHPKRSR